MKPKKQASTKKPTGLANVDDIWPLQVGVMPEESGFLSKPIWLTHSRYVHILIEHEKQIVGEGLTPLEFIFSVCQTFERVLEGSSQALLLIAPFDDNKSKMVVILISNSVNGDYTIKSAFFKTTKELKNKKLLWERGRTTPLTGAETVPNVRLQPLIGWSALSTIGIQHNKRKTNTIMNKKIKLTQKHIMFLLSKTNLSGLGYLKFSSVKEIPRSQIVTRTNLFQGRQHEFSQESVDKIVREGFDKSQEPIAVWQDPATGEYIVISGHSRWQASKILYANGQKNLAEMPVKVFNGTLEEAIDYALLESNRSGTAEGLMSDLAAYKRAATKGYTREKMLGLFKKDAYVDTLRDLSYLNTKGRFLEYLGTDSEKSFKYLLRNAQWVGILRRGYPNLSDFHEREMFDYLYNGKEVSKQTLFDTIERKVGNFTFNPNEPLNLKNIVSTTSVTDGAMEQIRTIQAEVDKLRKDRDRYEDNIARANAELTDGTREKRVKEFREQLTYINSNIGRKVMELERVQREMKGLQRSTSFDLFNPSGNEPPMRSKKIGDSAAVMALEEKARRLKAKLSKLIAA